MKFIEAVIIYQNQKKLLSIIEEKLKQGNPIVNPQGRWLSVFEMVHLKSQILSDMKKLESLEIDYQEPLIRSS